MPKNNKYYLVYLKTKPHRGHTAITNEYKSKPFDSIKDAITLFEKKNMEIYHRKKHGKTTKFLGTSIELGHPHNGFIIEKNDKTILFEMYGLGGSGSSPSSWNDLKGEEHSSKKWIGDKKKPKKKELIKELKKI